MACHGELAGKFPVEKQCFMLILKKTDNILNTDIFVCIQKKVEVMALSIFLTQNLEHHHPQHG